MKLPTSTWSSSTNTISALNRSVAFRNLGFSYLSAESQSYNFIVNDITNLLYTANGNKKYKKLEKEFTKLILIGTGELNVFKRAYSVYLKNNLNSKYISMFGNSNLFIKYSLECNKIDIVDTRQFVDSDISQKKFIKNLETLEGSCAFFNNKLALNHYFLKKKYFNNFLRFNNVIKLTKFKLKGSYYSFNNLNSRYLNIICSFNLRANQNFFNVYHPYGTSRSNVELYFKYYSVFNWLFFTFKNNTVVNLIEFFKNKKKINLCRKETDSFTNSHNFYNNLLDSVVGVAFLKINKMRFGLDKFSGAFDLFEFKKSRYKIKENLVLGDSIAPH